MNRIKTIFQSIAIEIILIFCIGCANLHPTPIWYFFFYNLLYGIVLSLLIPLYLLRKEKNISDFIGVKKWGRKQSIVLAVFIAFSVGGQLIPIAASGSAIPWNVLPMGIIPLIMTTFFEEFLFRGFMQNKFEKDFGTLPAVFFSGLMFSLYHLGYPGFRTLGDLLLLFAVGVGFAAAYKLSGNNLIAAYFVNLPNAFVTYILKQEQFPILTMSSTIAGIVTLVIIVTILFCQVRRIFDKFCCSRRTGT